MKNMTRQNASLFQRELMREALGQAFVKLNPGILFRNPVMFTVEIGTFIMLLVSGYTFIRPDADQGRFGYNLTLFLVLLLTLLFANFAETIAEARGKAQANSLRKTREETPATLVLPDGSHRAISSSQLKKGDVFLVRAGELIPTDGEIMEGLATIDESAITGESAPVIREAGGDKSSVTGGTKVLSDKIKVVVTSQPGESFLDKMIALVEGASRQKTPNEIALTILLAGFTLVFVIVCVTLKPFADYAQTPITIAALLSLFVCLIPTTIGGLLSAIGIAGMDRALRANVITKSGKAVETAGDIDVLLLDKTGTITIGNRKATNFFARQGVEERHFIQTSYAGSLADHTPEGKSITELASRSPHIDQVNGTPIPESAFVPFTAETRSSGVNLPDGTRIRKGAFDAIRLLTQQAGHDFPEDMATTIKKISNNGGTPLVVSENEQVIGVIELQDIIKTGISERFERLRKMGVKTVMVTGDNPLTARYIARKAGVDDFIAEAKPEDKMNYIRAEQAQGKYNHNRHNEFNVNLALVKAAYASNRGRANLALMAGTYAQYNLAAEQPLLRKVYEANAGIRMAEGLWLDAGIFTSHIGWEGAISKDNYTLTRSLAAENSPYYESGVKVTYAAGSKWVLTGLVLNGWQNIREPEGNSGKAIGTQIQFKPNDKLLFNSSSFLGNEKPDSARQIRYFHDFYLTFQPHPEWKLAVIFDIGMEKKLIGTGYNPWYSPAILVHYSLSDQVALAARAEYYRDKNGVIIHTATPNGFKTRGYSFNLDYAATGNVLMRLESRILDSQDAIFTRSNRQQDKSVAITSSLAVSF